MDCINVPQVKDEAPKLVKALEALKNPKEFAFHIGKDLIVNHADIFREVSASIDDYHAQKWEDFGKDTGAALSKLLVGTNEMSAAEDEMWPVVLKGVLEGFGLTKDLDEMKACLSDTVTEIKDVEAAVELLEKKDAHDVLDGLGKLGSALEQLPTAVEMCEAAAKDVHQRSVFVIHLLSDLYVSWVFSSQFAKLSTTVATVERFLNQV